MSLCRLLLTLLLSGVSLSGLAQDSLEDAQNAMRAGRPNEAARILQLLADKGDAKSQLQLGMLYYTGKGVTENEKLAVELLTSSARQGNVEAMLQLGNAYTFGSETPKLVADADIEAAQWYFKAASAGNADAQYSLGLLFMAGKGVQKNDNEARNWMQKAAQQGHADAKNTLSRK